MPIPQPLIGAKDNVCYIEIKVAKLDCFLCEVSLYNRRLLRHKGVGACLYMPQNREWFLILVTQL